MSRVSKILMQLSGILILIVVWQVATGVLGLVKPVILPPPSDVLLTTIDMVMDGELFMHAGYSLLRVILGFLAAVVVAVPLGIAMGWVREISYVVDPVIEVLRPIPPIAWIGLALLWFNIGLTSAVFLVFIGAVFPILLNTVSGVRNVDRKLIEVAYTFGATDFEILRKVVMPAALPTIYTGMRVGMGIGWMCVVAAEMVAVKFGLGNLILEASNFLQTDKVLVGMIMIGILGLLINVAFQIVGDRIFAWQKGIGKGE
ncbi:ABC transporter permease [Methanocella arvoryzae]|uniref:ABC-type sulfonate import system,permease component n=1 Tax=Methanocella arvoryzae (strain DSM 22066 / NBRC 105507 / MRE50) TaxID=351160 RepID=Q0W6W5_METAR|nr:ABC transporter permease [Methanocella arvoryzae]CAJ35878.1 putative ABC-type sulfonate import system,permease component [Methanocella arvoryzae MRE50]